MQRGDLALQGVDLAGERRGSGRVSSRAMRACDAVGRRGERLLEAGEPAGAVERLGRHLEREAEVVQVPAQAALDAGALADQVGAVVDEQAQLALGAVEAGLGQVRLAQRGAGHAAASMASLLPRVRALRRVCAIELRRHAHAALAALDEEALEAAGDVTAVLEREAALGAEASAPRRAGARWPRRSVVTVSSPRSSPVAASRATTVWLFLCGSIPSTITAVPFRTHLRSAGPPVDRP